MTNQQLQSNIYIIDYLTDKERNDTIIKSAIEKLKGMENVNYNICNNPKEIGIVFDSINRGDAIIHFLAHGSQYGIGKITDTYFLEAIHWELILKSFENIQKRCNSLSINFLAVCYSNFITAFETKPYDFIWTISDKTNSIESSIKIYSKQNFNTIINQFDNSSIFHETIGCSKR